MRQLCVSTQAVSTRVGREWWVLGVQVAGAAHLRSSIHREPGRSARRQRVIQTSAARKHEDDLDVAGMECAAKALALATIASIEHTRDSDILFDAHAASYTQSIWNFQSA